MLQAFGNSLKIPELRVRIFFTLGLVFVCRIIESVSVPGIDAHALQQVVADVSARVNEGGFLGWMDLFSGGALMRCAVGAQGIMPYITASIILQLLTAVFPTLERLAREGEVGRQKISQYTRYLTIVICIVQGFAYARTLEYHPEVLGIRRAIVLNPGISFEFMTIINVVTATMLLMWLGDQITERGIGNGISLIITVNILSRFPHAVLSLSNMFKRIDGIARFSPFHLIGLIAMFFAVTAATIAITQGQRKIPIHTTKRIVGRKMYGGQDTYMPLRVNYSGVMPIIFAQAILQLPVWVLRAMPFQFCKNIANAFFTETGVYLFFYTLMILFFSYFWVATMFNPLQVADDLKKYGGYVPGIRPGQATAAFLDKTMMRITLFGAIALTVIAIFPTILAREFVIPWNVASFFGGTSLLIVVGVVLDTMRQVESHLVMRHYDGFLRRGRLRGRR